MPNKIIMKNGRNSQTKKASSAKKTTKKQSSRRNGTTALEAAKALVAANRTAARNGAKTTRKSSSRSNNRRNGIGILEIMRNGIFGQQSIMEVGKTVALGSAGVVSAGIIGRSVMSLGGNRVAGVGVQPFVIQAGVEALASVTIIQMAANKIFNNSQNAAIVMTGGLIKSGTTLFNGLMPDVWSYNPFAHTALPQGNLNAESIAGLYDTENASGNMSAPISEHNITELDEFGLNLV